MNLSSKIFLIIGSKILFFFASNNFTSDYPLNHQIFNLLKEDLNYLPKELLNIIAQYADISDQEKAKIINYLFKYFTLQKKLEKAKDKNGSCLLEIYIVPDNIILSLQKECSVIYNTMHEITKKLVDEIKSIELNQIKHYCINLYKQIENLEIKNSTCDPNQLL